MGERPILWSFRRCPYAIRARLAIADAGLAVELREVDLACKPPELLERWSAGTVPVLQSVEGEVIGESLEVMRWALAQQDPQQWLQPPGEAGAHPAMASDGGASVVSTGGLTPLAEPIAALIAENDGPFKHHLDRFKYASRYEGADPAVHRREALAILRRWNQQLAASMAAAAAASGARALPAGDGALGRGDAGGDEGGDGKAEGSADRVGWLLGERACLADWALLPFVRQFRLADPEGFAAADGIAALRGWLARFEQGPELARVMAPPLAPRQPWRSPRWLYHLALAEEWRQARAEGVYRRSTRGLSLEQVGFLHASHAHQIAATYARFYADAGPVRLLTIDPALLAEAGLVVREEPAPDSGERFPHLYGGPLPCGAVVGVEPYRP